MGLTGVQREHVMLEHRKFLPWIVVVVAVKVKISIRRR
jgi:hypothetical protein